MQLLNTGRTDDGSGDEGLRAGPCERYLSHANVPGLGDRLYARDDE